MDTDNNKLPAVSLRDIGLCYRSNVKFLNKSHKEKWILKGLNFDILHGESVGLLGRNGAGKSTLLRVIGGLIKPDKGEVVHYTHSVSLLSLQVGFLPYLTGRDNAVLSGLLLGMPRKEIEKKLEQIKYVSGLEDYFDEPVDCYSTGMRSRLGFSTAVNVDPDVLLIDEILAVGDANFRKRSSEIIMEKIHSDKTIILVSHSLETVRECCNRAIWIDDGKIKKDGNVESVIAAYEGSNES